ncbi:MAG: hypothetical protein ACI8Y4_005213 [Candidatus Poriferisodalaceae bacterium]
MKSEHRVREMIHGFNEQGMRSLDPQWAGGRPRQITTDDEAFIVATATTRPEKLGQPFTRWSIRKLVGYLAANDRLLGRCNPMDDATRNAHANLDQLHRSLARLTH